MRRAPRTSNSEASLLSASPISTAETAVSGDDVRKDYGERRLRVLGFIDGLLYAAVVTPRGEKIRVISLRRANRREERAYAKERQSS